MHCFHLVRAEDVSGVSGTGIVAEGVQFTDGTVVLQWRNHCSLGIYQDIERVIEIHGHEGRTEVVWLVWLPAPEDHPDGD